MAVLKSLLPCLALFVETRIQAEPEDRRGALQRQLGETTRQRASNQRLMWDAALGAAEGSQNLALRRGELSSAGRLVRLVEIAKELKAVAARDDAHAATKLISEGGRLIALEGLTRFKDSAQVIAGSVGTILSTFDIAAAVQAYTRFRSAASEDLRLLRRETELRRKIADIRSSASPSQIAAPQYPPNGALQLQRRAELADAELDDALTLMRFSETKDWSVEDVKNMDRIAARYPVMQAEYRAALDREARRRTEEKTARETLGPADAGGVKRLNADPECIRNVLRTSSAPLRCDCDPSSSSCHAYWILGGVAGCLKQNADSEVAKQKALSACGGQPSPK